MAMQKTLDDSILFMEKQKARCVKNKKFDMALALGNHIETMTFLKLVFHRLDAAEENIEAMTHKPEEAKQ